MTLSAAIQAAEIQLELLTGPLTGIYDTTGMGSMLFAILGVAAQLDRDYIRDKTLEGQKAAAARGDRSGDRGRWFSEPQEDLVGLQVQPDQGIHGPERFPHLS
jgi:DNA invertase Pin-like site-specific DNA recombinase